MIKNKSIGIIFYLLLGGISVFAQKAERDLIRKGNRLYKDSVYVKAEVNYRKALDINPKSSISMYNLGNSLLQQNKSKEAMEQFVSAAKIEKDKSKLAEIYHNMGVIFQSNKDYSKAIEAYKQSLKNNSKDNETRYNLALAQKLLKDQQQNQKNQDKNKEDKKDQDKKKDQKKDQKQDNKKDQNQQKEKNKQQPSQPQNKENQMSKENAEQLLNSVLQDEKGIQDKIKKQQVVRGGRLEKDW